MHDLPRPNRRAILLSLLASPLTMLSCTPQPPPPPPPPQTVDALLRSAQLWSPGAPSGSLDALVRGVAALLSAPSRMPAHVTMRGDHRIATSRRTSEADNRLALAEETGEPVIAADYLQAGYPWSARLLRRSPQRMVEQRLLSLVGDPDDALRMQHILISTSLRHGVPPSLALGLGAWYSGLDPRTSDLFGGPIPFSGPPDDVALQTERMAQQYLGLLEQVEPLAALMQSALPLPAAEQTDFAPLIALSAWIHGIDETRRWLDAFLALGSGWQRERLGAGPVGLDAWLAVLASTGQAVPILEPVTVLGWSRLLGHHDPIITAPISPPPGSGMLPDDWLTEATRPLLAAASPAVAARIRELRLLGTDAVQPEEAAHYRAYTMPAQAALLQPELRRWFGDDFVDAFERGSRRPLSRMRDLFVEGARRQEAALVERLESGELLPMQPRGDGLPYFCQQVGHNEGLDNHSDALFAHRLLVQMLYALVELINVQIDTFNTAPEALGYASFPWIPHVDAVKVSGAFRPMMQFYELNRRYPRRTTRRLSAHTIGHALDLGSLAPAIPDAGVVRFRSEMRDRDGVIHLQAGDILPTVGFGQTTRQIISRMIGRALTALEAPMAEAHGAALYPLWEPRQLNWHVVVGMLDR